MTGLRRNWSGCMRKDFCARTSCNPYTSSRPQRRRWGILKLMAMDVLIVGSGAREHALAWKLKQSPRVGKLYVAPGNGGTGILAENVSIGVLEFEKLAAFAKEKKIGLTIPGPDDAFVGGIVDVFKSHGLRVWGPTKEAAQIEGSKAFAKQLMHDAKIPTADFEVFSNP